MEITYDPVKRDMTVLHRNMDFESAPEIFAGLHFTFADERRDYGEIRYLTIGFLKERMVVMVWTPRGAARHIISLRKANDREKRDYQSELGRS